jgi:hypothetical protein
MHTVLQYLLFARPYGKMRLQRVTCPGFQHGGRVGRWQVCIVDPHLASAQSVGTGGRRERLSCVSRWER